MLNTRQWRLYDYLKNNCVGYKNKKSGKEIYNELKNEYPDLFENNSIKRDIHFLRNSDLINRRISSSNNGYWLAVKSEEIEENKYLASLTLSYIKTCLNCGALSKSVLHKYIHDLKVDRVPNLQTKIKIGKYEEDFIHIYSDDLLK